MTPADWIKLLIILPVFFGLAPLLGALVKDKPEQQRWMFGLMCFMTVNGLFGPGNWGLTLGSVELYRGHAKGYHFYFNHILAIALIVAAWLKDRKTFRWVPPGMALYALFILCCSLSIINAPRVDYVLMAIHKMIFFAVIGIAAFHWMRRREDIQFFMKVMAVTMCWQALIVLKMKYLQGIYQVRGTFEHQNPLSMYAVMIGMPLLAVAMGPEFKGRRWCTAGYMASAIIVQSALSRAALIMFAGGTVMVALLSLMEKPTKRRLGLLAGMSCVGALGLLLTLDTIISRFGDQGNTASSELRDVLNEAARQMQHEHPLGIGWNNYALCINTPYSYADVVYDWTRGRNMKVDTDKPNAPVESHYYLLFGENGYAGLISWLLVIGVGVWRNFRGFLGFAHGFERCVCLGLMAGCSLNYVQSTLERVLT
ncbi:MAG: hypothetical protein JWL81_1744, partial [Verrucomicrobiales bacterium]|nr:hypothetical protein [Verrucomicrobiales bacterium]